jgi:integrase
MSVTKAKGRRFYSYDFQYRGHRFQGSTGCTSRREAEQEERRLKAEKRELFRRGGIREPMTLSAAAERYMIEAGKFQSTADTLDTALVRIVEFLGPGTFLHEITGADVSRLVAARRNETTGPRGDPRPVSNADVNRWTIKPLRRLLNYADKVWKAQTGDPVGWSHHLLPEPKERVRELGPDEQARLFEALRPDYHEIVEFSLLTGVRLENAVGLKWTQIRLDTSLIEIDTKGEAGARPVQQIPLTPAVLAILQRCRPHSIGDQVFTYVAQRTKTDPRTGKRFVKGRRYPVSRSSLRRAWDTARKHAGLTDLRWHDLRHTAATRVLRASNLRVAQRLLGHRDITTTAKYAHAQMDDVRAGLEAAAAHGLTDKSTDTAPQEGPKVLKGKGN